MKLSLLPLLTLAVLLSACEKQPSQPTFSMQWLTAEPDTGQIINAEVWQQVSLHEGFDAHWSGKQDETKFQCYLSPHYFYFKFQVPEQTLTLKEPFEKKLDVCNEDRAEIFLSATPDMHTYYCMEMDPKGRALDYVTNYYRKYDYNWAFHSLQMETSILDNSYIVAGRLSTAEMLQLGIPLDEF